jgi:hypothetical protein
MLVATAILTECTTKKKKCQFCAKTEVVTDSFDCGAGGRLGLFVEMMLQSLAFR